MLSKNKQKFIRQLALKKHRDASKCFVAEGPKIVEELMGVFPCSLLLATAEFLKSHKVEAAEIIEVSERELTATSFLKTPQQVMGVFQKKTHEEAPAPKSSLVLALDDVQDPGNLGTILRLADWFGIRQVVCSTGTADAFAPKVVQATMGALARVNVIYADLPQWLNALPAGCPIYGTQLDGADIYGVTLTDHGVIVMGNEGNGISPAVARRLTHHLLIPSYPPGTPTSESLNVATATAIVCAEFRRRMLK